MPHRAKSTPAFTLNAGDRFHKIVVSDPFLCAMMPDTRTVITIISIHRASGLFSVVNVIKSYKSGKCVSRLCHDKDGITAKTVEKALIKIQTDFSQGIFSQGNNKIAWENLDLSPIADKQEQIKVIKKWGRLHVG